MQDKVNIEVQITLCQNTVSLKLQTPQPTLYFPLVLRKILQLKLIQI